MNVKFIIIGIAIVVLFVSEFLWRKKSSKFNLDIALKIGDLLFKDDSDEFRKYVNLFVNEKEKFKEKYESDFEEIGIEFNDIKLLDLVIQFGVDANKILIIDWRGEENDGEVQDFCEEILKCKIDWEEVNQFKVKERESDVLVLFEKINADLSQLGYTLIFSTNSNDSYEIGVTKIENFDKIKMIKKDLFTIQPK